MYTRVCNGLVYCNTGSMLWHKVLEYTCSTRVHVLEYIDSTRVRVLNIHTRVYKCIAIWHTGTAIPIAMLPYLLEYCNRYRYRYTCTTRVLFNIAIGVIYIYFYIHYIYYTSTRVPVWPYCIYIAIQYLWPYLLEYST